MKKNTISFASLLLCTIFLLSSCKKETTPHTAQVTVKIDYLGNGGTYSDNIDAVPNGLIVGINGPYEADAGKDVNIRYLPDSRWPEPVQYNLTGGFTAGKKYIIHCYIEQISNTQILGKVIISEP